MANLAIACANCGAKYRLPETFNKDHAKCSKCGSTIDVASQRETGTPLAAGPAKAQPAKAQPAAAKARPAKARPARARGAKDEGDEGASSARASTRRSASRRGGSDDEGSGSRRASRSGGSSRSSGRRGRGGEEESSGSNKTMLFGGIGVAAIAIVGAIMFMTSGDDEKDLTEDKKVAAAGDSGKEAANNNTSDPKVAEAAASKDESTPAEASGDKADEGAAAVEPSKAADEGAKKPASSAPALSKEERAALTPNEMWKLSKAETLADVYVPSSELEPIPWPESIDEATREDIKDKLETAGSGGIRGTRAKRALEEMGYPAVIGMVNHLRELDYTDANQVFFAYELNRALEAMTEGINTGFIPIEFGMDMNTQEGIKTADRNAKTVKAWQSLPLSTEEAWQAYMDKRKKSKK